MTFIAFARRAWDWVRYGFKSLLKGLRPKGLRNRFVLIILLPIVFLQVILFSFFYNRHWDAVSRRLAQDIAGEIAAVIHIIDNVSMPPDELNAVLEQIGQEMQLDIAFVPARSDIGRRKQKRHYSSAHLYAEIRQMDYPTAMREVAGQQQLVTLQLDKGTLKVLVPRKRFFSSTVYAFLLWMVGSSFFLFGIAYLFMKNQVRSVARLARAMGRFGMGQTNFPFKPEGATEVRQAGMSFVQMRDRILRYLQERTAMLAGVSHDIRTPLARMKLELEMMPPGASVSDLQADVAEMEKMLAGYLEFARNEGRENMESVVLNTLLQDIIHKHRKMKKRVDLHEEQIVAVMARPNDLLRAITNILSNAGRYARRARVTLGIRNHMARIVVDDDGPGIPEHKRAEVFKAFYRLEESRNTATGGVGLGLTIARDIILSHGGTISLSDSPLGGLRVVMALPLKTRET
ncbi:MAG: ATP-binding protein [Alphaproteobacteria bacterium]|nr:ATP-binding protein [Alphaproteobacteria bacterium]